MYTQSQSVAEQRLSHYKQQLHDTSPQPYHSTTGQGEQTESVIWLHAQLEISGYKGGDAVSLVGTKLCRSVTVHNTALYTVDKGLRGRSIPQSVAID